MTSRGRAVAEALADAHRREWAFVLAATVRVAGDLGVAEECAQEAFAEALTAWGRSGIPDRPGAWLTTAARRRAVDQVRREATFRRKLPLLVEPVEADAGGRPWGEQDGTGEDDAVCDGDSVGAVPDDRLRLIFTCCHPALDAPARVALTLRLVCGVPTPDVARAFLVPEATMAARITRAKKKIAAARIPYRTPSAHDLPERLDSVLATVHLLYSTGHTAPTGEQLVREDVCERALDLAGTLVRLLPDAAEARGLLGLLLLTDARRATRLDAQGRLVLLEDQDRARWDGQLVVRGLHHTVAALSVPRPGRFALQAAIAGAHAVAPSWAQTDWPRLVRLYGLLFEQEPSPVVALNRAVAIAFAEGLEEGLAELDRWAAEPRLATYPYLQAARADLLRRLGRAVDAADAYRQAIAMTTNHTETEFLQRRLDDVLTHGTPVPGCPTASDHAASNGTSKCS